MHNMDVELNEMKKKRSGAFLRIILPLIILVAITAVVAYFLVFSGDTDNQMFSKAGDIAVMYLIFLIITPMFFIIALLIFFIVINIKASHQLSSIFPIITGKIEQVNETVRKTVTATSTPFIEIDTYLNTLSRCFSKKDRNGK